MRFRVRLIPVESVAVVPWNYQHHLQGVLYRVLIEEQPELDELLHRSGFPSGARRFRMLTFSKLLPRAAETSHHGLILHPPVYWLISTALEAVANALVQGLLKRAEIAVGGQQFFIDQVEDQPVPDFSAGKMRFETLSPIVVSRPVTDQRGRLTKQYLAPDDPEFWQRVASNLARKADALGIEPVGSVQFKPIGRWRSRLISVQGARVRGYEGRFVATGDPALLCLAYDVGLGERNGQGFGMIGLMRSGRPPQGRRGYGSSGNGRRLGDGEQSNANSCH